MQSTKKPPESGLICKFFRSHLIYEEYHIVIPLHRPLRAPLALLVLGIANGGPLSIFLEILIHCRIPHAAGNKFVLFFVFLW